MNENREKLAVGDGGGYGRAVSVSRMGVLGGESRGDGGCCRKANDGTVEADDGLREADGVSGETVYEEKGPSWEALLLGRRVASPSSGIIPRKRGGDGDLLLP